MPDSEPNTEYKETARIQGTSQPPQPLYDHHVEVNTFWTKMKTIVIACLLLAVSIERSWARPRYLAIPLEDVEFLEVEPKEEVAQLTRTVRAALPRERRWNEEQKDDQQIVASEDQGRFQRGIHGGGGGGGDSGHQDHVDFGAHTGHHGAFGWYADFPVQKDH